MNLITDRTFSDVEAVAAVTNSIKAGTATAEEVRQYLNEINKGAYTYRDLNRVEEAVLYVSARLKEYGYFAALPTVAEWSVEDKPNEEDFVRYLGNVARIRNAIAVWASTPEAPTDMIGFDIFKANALEQILVDVDQILNLVKDAWFFSGDLYSAEV